ncbi:acyl-CoA synthetase-like protein [Leptotrombidium deliense]|uniref:Acyl-CoA synthetase-like protein n=1 Tax=Leptotrombidium deliense TaxID=299467 RepID=A0A443RSN9_9ACAR|nr:acyl-CoA synthetase-like protein [Leptotrombidium deliense]
MYTIRPEDLMQIGFSSGTTGTPKAVSRTHANNIASLSLSAPGFELVTEQDVVGVNSAYCHMSGIAMLINAFGNGATATILHCNEADSLIKALQRFPNINAVFSIIDYNFTVLFWSQLYTIMNSTKL